MPGPVTRLTFRVPLELTIDVPGVPGTQEFDVAETEAHAAVRAVLAALMSDDDAVRLYAELVDLPDPSERRI